MNRAVLILLVAVAVISPAPAEVAATAPATPLTREMFLSGLGGQLVRHFNLEGELELELLRSWTPPPQVAARWAIEVSEFPAVASSTMIVRCRLVADGQPLAEPTVVLRAALWRDAWAARRPLTAQAAFDPAQLERRRVDVFRDREALPVSVGDGSYLFTCGVPAGRLLTWRDVARRPLVRRGEMVEVSAVDGMLTVTMKALAMENGARGDTVTIRNPDSRKDFAAVVIDQNHVEVRF